jgi:hypothetical protein
VTESFEDALRQALRTDDPGELFTRRVLARLPADKQVVSVSSRPAFNRWLPWSAGIAASLLLGFGMRQQWLEQREQAEGMRAKRELLQALRVTSGKLDLAYQAVAKEDRT